MAVKKPLDPQAALASKNRKKLQELYLQRSVLNAVIDSLEQYERFCSKSMVVGKKTSA